MHDLFTNGNSTSVLVDFAKRVSRQEQSSKPDAARATTAGKFALKVVRGIKETAKQGPIFFALLPPGERPSKHTRHTHKVLSAPPVFTPHPPIVQNQLAINFIGCSWSSARVTSFDAAMWVSDCPKMPSPVEDARALWYLCGILCCLLAIKVCEWVKEWEP